MVEVEAQNKKYVMKDVVIIGVGGYLGDSL